MPIRRFEETATLPSQPESVGPTPIDNVQFELYAERPANFLRVDAAGYVLTPLAPIVRFVATVAGYTTRLVHDQFWDWRLGIRTMRSTAAVGGGAKAGDPTGYDVLFSAARTIKDSDVVFDIGCGRGRACVVFARAGATVTGVELSPVAAAAARKNGVTVIEADARTVCYDGVTVLWLYNPFGAEALRAVLRKANAPRAIYYNASEAHRAVFLAEGYAVVHREVVALLSLVQPPVRNDCAVLHYERSAAI